MIFMVNQKKWRKRPTNHYVTDTFSNVPKIPRCHNLPSRTLRPDLYI